MDIKVDKLGEGRNSYTILSWGFEGREISLEFSTIARPVYSEATNRVYVSEYLKSLIYVYSQSGELLNKFSIPKKVGYKYRGLNRNKTSQNGVSLLYVPVDGSAGNDWGDIEQYELKDESPHLGDFIDIYR